MFFKKKERSQAVTQSCSLFKKKKEEESLYNKWKNDFD